MSHVHDDVSKEGSKAAEIDDALGKEITIQEATVSLPPPVDGGFRAWLQVVGCFLVFFNVW
jgi:hypothetical protein